MKITDNQRGAIYMNLAMAAFTLNDTGMKAATQTVPLFEAITLRGLLTTFMLVLLGLWTRGLQLRQSPRDRAAILIRSVADIAATFFFLVALTHMPLANLSAILQFLPLAVTLGAALVFREHIGWRRLSAIMVGFIGVLLIIRPGTEGFDKWSVFGLCSVACVVVRDLSTRGLSHSVPSVTVALYTAVGVTLMGITGVIFTGWQPFTLHEALILAAASMALIAGYMFGVMAMRVGDIGFIAPFRYTSLLWAIVLGWLVFGTLPDSLTLTGAAIVIATGIFTLYRERKLALRSLAEA